MRYADYHKIKSLPVPIRLASTGFYCHRVYSAKSVSNIVL